MPELAKLTGSANYFEDFTVGMVIRHARGKTITAVENVQITNLVLNTAQGHFNEDITSKRPFGKIVVYGGVTFSMVLGLSTQDCCENALAEVGLDNVKLTTPVTHGDTIYAYSEVMEVEARPGDDAGFVTFRHYGYNQRDDLVAQVDRRVLLKTRAKWGAH